MEHSFDRAFDSLESLADALGDSLQAQVTIEDENHHVIGYSSHRFESDPARISTIIGKKVPSAVIAGLRQQGILQALENAAGPLRIPALPEVGLGPRLAVCLKHRGEVLGYIWVVDTGDLKLGLAEAIVEQAARSAGRYLLKQRGWKARQEKTQEDFFWKLLTSYYETESSIARDAEALSILLPGAYHIGVFECGRRVDENVQLRFRQAFAAENKIRLLFQTCEHERIIALFSFAGWRGGPLGRAELLRQLVERAGGEGGSRSAGCSMETREYRQAGAAYREAKAVLELRRLFPYHARSLLLYEDAGFLRHLPDIMEIKRSGTRPSPFLQPLLDHDEEHKSELLRTLAVYLSLDSHLKESAAYLHIHTNTLMYRLNRIAEIAGVSLKNAHYRTSVYIDLLTEQTERVNMWLAAHPDLG
ncbi:PucR family transcriptional regulator [Paenibacillus glufosinatiresistens]|uniref:PucR family transcriptional regulator n=1 Tax=Paenibacillus glufosinatiresistens TaxID=3070657 RepID=UPI00286E5CD3|nr:helix-turn-helix domain-containing protein [Paenibacillus sp. YX.27]